MHGNELIYQLTVRFEVVGHGEYDKKEGIFDSKMPFFSSQILFNCTTGYLAGGPFKYQREGSVKNNQLGSIQDSGLSKIMVSWVVGWRQTRRILTRAHLDPSLPLTIGLGQVC